MNKTKFQFPTLDMEKIGKVLKLVSGSLSPRKRPIRFKHYNLQVNNIQQTFPRQKKEQNLKGKQSQTQIVSLKKKRCLSKQQFKQNKNDFNFCTSKNVFVFANKNSLKIDKDFSEQINLSPTKFSFFQEDNQDYDRKSRRSAYNFQYKNQKQNCHQKPSANNFKLRKINSSQNYRRSQSLQNGINETKGKNSRSRFQFQPWDNPQGWQPQPFEYMFRQ